MLTPYLLAAIKTEAAYKIDFIGSILSLSIFFGLQYLFFSVISDFIQTDAMPKSWLLYFFLTYTAGTLTVNFFSASVISFFERLASGQANTDLLKPTSVFSLILIKGSRPIYALSAVIILTCIGLTTDIVTSGINVELLPFYLLLVALGISANIGFVMIFCSFTVLTQRSFPVDFVHSELSALAIIPHHIYPANISYLLITALPMVMYSSVATDLLHGKASLLTAAFAISALITTTVAVFLAKTIFKKFDSIGG